MTELTQPDDAPAQPFPDWPPASAAGVTDPVVARALARLEVLPQAPVGDHEAAYSQLHDDLLAALDADPADGGA